MYHRDNARSKPIDWEYVFLVWTIQLRAKYETKCSGPNGQAPRKVMREAGTVWLMSVCAIVPLILVAGQTCEVGPAGPELFGYEVVAEFPHDSRAFTQGLQHDTVCSNPDACTEVFWESTGRSVSLYRATQPLCCQ